MQTQPVTLLVHPPHIDAHAQALTKAKLLICPKGGSPVCLCQDCRKIDAGTHHLVQWLRPSGGYTLADITPLIETVAFALSGGDQFLFIIDQVELFSPAVSNRLLKTLEEPPAGYHFLLLTSNLNDVLPTIRSRSIIEYDQSTPQANHTSPLLEYFNPNNLIFMNVSLFEECLASTKPTHLDTQKLADELIKLLSQPTGSQDLSGKFKTARAHAITAFQTLPCQGGADIFWKLLFMRFAQDFKVTI